MSGLGTPFLDWATANGIDIGRMPMWPELEIDTDAGLIRIEMFWRGPERDEDTGEPVLQRLGQTIGTLMREYPLVEPMSDDLAASWALNSPHERQALRLQNAFRGLPPGAGPKLFVVAPGQRLMFVMPPMPSEEMNEALRGIAGLLPGVNVSVVSGPTAVVAVEHRATKAYRGGA